MFREALDAVDEKPDFDPALHERFMRAVDETPADQMSLTEKFRAANYLQLAVLWLAGENNWKVEKSMPDGRGGRCAEEVVDETRLPSEMAALHKIRDTLSYGPALGEWIAAKLPDVTAALAQDDFGARLWRWSAMTVEEKRQLLQDTVERSLAPYRREGFEIAVPPVIFDEDMTSASAVTGTRLTREGTRIVPVVESIRVGIGLRDAPTPFMAVILTYHESVHALITQLAAARARGQLPAGDPLQDEAETALADRLYGRSTPLIPSVYDGDIEEKFVYERQRLFMGAFFEAFTPRQQPAVTPA